MDTEPAQHDEVKATPERAKRAGFVLTEDDIKILKLIYEFRFLRREHIHALTSRHTKSVHRRLFKLKTAGYLAVIRLPQKQHIYALGTQALPILVEQGSASLEHLANERLRTHELKELFLKHEMMIVDLHVMLSLATRNESHIQLVNWREGRELFDSVSISDHTGREKLPVRADALFTLEDSRRPAGANRMHFFLEADRSTASQARFRDKIRAYWHYREQGLHAKKYDMKSFRVLTVTLTNERARNLRELAASLLPERGRKSYLFTSINNFSLQAPETILGEVYYSARSGDVRVPLIPPFQAE